MGDTRSSGVRESAGCGSPEGTEVGTRDGDVGVGDTVRTGDGARVRRSEGVGVGGGVGAVVRSLAGGGASGGAGEVGVSGRLRPNGSATSSATAHITPTPVAVRTRRRRDALRRSVS